MRLVVFATPSAGEPIPNARLRRIEEQALAKAQQRLSTAEKGTPEQATQRTAVARVGERLC